VLPALRLPLARLLGAATLACTLTFPLACAGEAKFEYRVPEVVDEATLLARLTPTKNGELVIANFWASW
jgi:hypothetical protein